MERLTENIAIDKTGTYELILQSDGNLVVYRIADRKPIGATGHDRSPLRGLPVATAPTADSVPEDSGSAPTTDNVPETTP